MRQLRSEVSPKEGRGTWGEFTAFEVRGTSPLDAARDLNTRIGVGLRTRWPGSAGHIGVKFERQSVGEAFAALSAYRLLSFLSSVLSFTAVRHSLDRPNKAPEPTSCSVTSRAISRLSEMKLQTENRILARAAPEQAVAHL